jgi:exonuclease VII large subunit
MKEFSKSALLFLVIVILAFLALSHPVLAQSSQASYTANLNYLTVNLSYPSQVLPGDNVVVNLQASAKRSLDSVTLTVQIFYSDGGALHQVASATANSNYMDSGGSLSKTIHITIPQDAPRTSLVASLTENVQSTYYAYSYAFYPMNYNYSSSNCYYYDYGYCNYNYGYPYYPYYYAYPSDSYSTITDSGVAPLSYIKAPTPEYTALQSQYQSLQQQLQQSQAQYQQLQQNLQNSQNTIAQQNATIANLNQQLSSSKQTTGTFEVAAAGFAVVAVGILVAFLRKGKGPPLPKPTP